MSSFTTKANDDDWVGTEERQSVAALFADSIDHLYRVAIAVDPSPRSQIAYACYLAEHGQPIEAFREFDEILNLDKVAGDPVLLAEIAHRLERIERRLERDDSTTMRQHGVMDWRDLDLHEDEADDEDWSGATSGAGSDVADAIRQLMEGTRQRSPRDFSRIVAELDLHTLEDVGDMMCKARQYRAHFERRRTGTALLKLALYCGRREWFHVEVECLREAIRCFAQVVMEIHNGQLQARAELAAISIRQV